jgi:hypothetical protein
MEPPSFEGGVGTVGLELDPGAEGEVDPGVGFCATEPPPVLGGVLSDGLEGAAGVEPGAEGFCATDPLEGVDGAGTLPLSDCPPDAGGAILPPSDPEGVVGAFTTGVEGGVLPEPAVVGGAGGAAGTLGDVLPDGVSEGGTGCGTGLVTTGVLGAGASGTTGEGEPGAGIVPVSEPPPFVGGAIKPPSVAALETTPRSVISAEGVNSPG